jgi:hypothetical protein
MINNLMQNDKIKKKIINKSRKKNISQPGLTRLTHHPGHQIWVKKKKSSKRRP